MLIIKKHKNESVDVMLKKLKNKVRRTKQNEILRKRKQFLKPSVIKREERQKAIYVEKKFGTSSE